MRQILVSLATILLILVQPMQSQSDPSNEPDFFSDLYRIVSKHEGNLIYSPSSLLSVLSLMALGSNGATKLQFSAVLKVDPTEALRNYKQLLLAIAQPSNANFELADRIYIARGMNLQPRFADIARAYLNMAIETVDFSDLRTADAVNAWTRQATHDHIKSIVQQGDFNADTMLSVIHAAYFNGKWAHAFDADFTRSADFHVGHGSTQLCPMMIKQDVYLWKKDEYLEAQIIEMPLLNATQAFYVILPEDRDGIEELELRLTNFSIQSIADNMMAKTVSLALPKFKMASSIDMKDTLTKMGLVDPFSMAADFSNLLENVNVHIDKIIQKSDFEIGEDGAEASSAMNVINMRKSLRPMTEVTFYADHPFVFVLMDKPCRAVVFQGRVSNCE